MRRNGSPIRDDKKKEIMDHLYLRAKICLEWYIDTVWCEETKRNIQKDLDSILYETEKRFNLEKIPFYFKLTRDDTGFLDVRAISRDLS